MQKNNFLGKPIYFFKSIFYEENPLLEADGGTHTEIYYKLEDLKRHKTENGVAFRELPYYDTEIRTVQNAVNVNIDEGEYQIDPSITYESCVFTLQSMVDGGTPLSEIDVESFQKELQLSQSTGKTL